jgi:hypothetical protein
MTRLVRMRDPSRRARRPADRARDVWTDLRVTPMTCLICGDLLFSRPEQQRGVCAPCYLGSLRDGRRWVVGNLAGPQGRQQSPARADAGAARSIPPRSANRGMP